MVGNNPRLLFIKHTHTPAHIHFYISVITWVDKVNIINLYRCWNKEQVVLFYYGHRNPVVYTAYMNGGWIGTGRVDTIFHSRWGVVLAFIIFCISVFVDVWVCWNIQLRFAEKSFSFWTTNWLPSRLLPFCWNGQCVGFYIPPLVHFLGSK